VATNSSERRDGPMASQLQELVKSETWSEAREQLARASGELTHLDKRVRELVRERPIATLLAAALVGHLIGRLVAATR
jgi:ElaB/YqjD/DUF883 family membrane-anchored ribosome-binding protein